MSNSYNTEQLLRSMAEQLMADGQLLLGAAELLKVLRESEGRKEEIKDLRSRVERWLK